MTTRQKAIAAATLAYETYMQQDGYKKEAHCQARNAAAPFYKKLDTRWQVADHVAATWYRANVDATLSIEAILNHPDKPRFLY